ncbi:MAG: hemerythrin domain-containing protein [Stackebrandtia sp.]
MTVYDESHTSLITVITEDHRALERVFTELESRAGTPEYRRNLADHAIAEMVRHMTTKEQFMYPAIRQTVENGDVAADRALEYHAQIEQLLKEFEAVDSTDPRFDQLLGQITMVFRDHVEYEEMDLMPRLQVACTAETIQELGRKVLIAKATAPTRPHPSTPDNPPANRIVDPGVGLIDKVRDVLTRRQT